MVRRDDWGLEYFSLGPEESPNNKILHELTV